MTNTTAQGQWCIVKIISLFSAKTYVVGSLQKRLSEVLLKSTHNICFNVEIRKISVLFGWRKKKLSGAI